MNQMDANKTYRVKNTQECYKQFWTNSGSNAPRNNICVTTYLLSQKASEEDEQDIRDTAGKEKPNS